MTKDGGVTWHGLNRQPQDPNGTDFIVFTDFAFDPATPGVIYAGTRSDGVWATADNGINWARMTQGAFGVSSFVGQATPTKPWTLLAASTGTLGGVVRVDARVRRPPQLGRPRHNGRRTLHTATCSGATAAGFGTTVRWLSAGKLIGTGRRLRLPAKVVALPVTCEVRLHVPVRDGDQPLGGAPARRAAVGPLGRLQPQPPRRASRSRARPPGAGGRPRSGNRWLIKGRVAARRTLPDRPGRSRP